MSNGEICGGEGSVLSMISMAKAIEPVCLPCVPAFGLEMREVRYCSSHVS